MPRAVATSLVTLKKPKSTGLRSKGLNTDKGKQNKKGSELRETGQKRKNAFDELTARTFRRKKPKTINELFEKNVFELIFYLHKEVSHSYWLLARVCRRWYGFLGPHIEHFSIAREIHNLDYKESVEMQRFLKIRHMPSFLDNFSEMLDEAWPDDLKHLPIYNYSRDGPVNAQPTRLLCMFLASSHERRSLYDQNALKEVDYEYWCNRFVNLLARHHLHKQLVFFIENYSVPDMVKDNYDPGACVEAAKGNFLKTLRKDNWRFHRVKMTCADRLKTVKLLIRAGFWYGKTTCAAAAGSGDMKLLKFLRGGSSNTEEFGYPVKCDWDETTITQAILHGKFKVAKWAYEWGCPFDSTACEAAASRKQNLGLRDLEYLIDCKCECDENVSKTAAKKNNMQILELLHTKGRPLSFDIPYIAAKRGFGNILEWCKDTGYFGDYLNQHLVRVAMTNGGVGSFRELMNQQYKLDEDSIDEVLIFGTLQMVETIDEICKYKWNSLHCKKAVEHNRLCIFKYLQSQTPSWKSDLDDLLSIAYTHPDKELYNYLYCESSN
jgi:hypothetical protein